MELILFLFVVLFVTGGARWVWQRLLAGRDYTRQLVANHRVGYSLSCALALLSGIALAGEGYWKKELSLVPALVVAAVTCVFTLPVYFVIGLFITAFYRTFIAPAVDIARPVVRGVKSAFASPSRREESAEEARAAKERVRRERAEAEAKAEAKKRREDARAACEILYALHAPEIGGRFPKAEFDRFVARFLADDRAPEEVERKAAELQLLIRQHAEKVAGGKTETLAAVQAWYAEQLRELAAVPDGPMKESFQAVLLKEYNDRMMRAMGAGT